MNGELFCIRGSHGHFIRLYLKVVREGGGGGVHAGMVSQFCGGGGTFI